jgi:hypothetical protein
VSFGIDAGMIRVAATLVIYGPTAEIELLANRSLIDSAMVAQVGGKSPARYKGVSALTLPWHEFDSDNLDEEFFNYLNHQRSFFHVISAFPLKIFQRHFLISPVTEDPEHWFSCLLTARTVQLIAEFHLAFEVAPIVSVPDYARLWSTEAQSI